MDECKPLMSGSADKALRLWDTASRRCVKVLKGRGSHSLTSQLNLTTFGAHR